MGISELSSALMNIVAKSIIKNLAISLKLDLRSWIHGAHGRSYLTTPIFLEQELLEDEASTLMFSGSRLTSQVGATLLLLNLCHTHGTSNLFISNLFSILSSSILPTINHLPKNNYQASKRLKQLGLDYEAVHLCPNNCILFCGEGICDLEECTQCKAPRYKKVAKAIARCL